VHAHTQKRQIRELAVPIKYVPEPLILLDLQRHELQLNQQKKLFLFLAVLACTLAFIGAWLVLA
jgi:hypothetical protein